MRILIAEDDVTSRTILTGVLKMEGHEVIATVNGVQAWEILQQPDPPALIILDWLMPQMDGPEVVRRVRALKTNRPPYIIMLTSKGDKADIIAGLDAGANDYLSKPFDRGELRARIEVGRRMIEMQDALLESREILAHQATHDPLTGLANRRAILERLREELARAKRQGSRLAVAMCDIDHFKQVNDTHGHQTGDDVLCGVAKLLIETNRVYDAVGRLGGEEFLVIASMTQEKNWVSVFSRLCARIAESRIDTRSGLLTVTMSIGAVCTAADSTVDAILEATDKALYQAKNQGRNRVVAYNGSCETSGFRPAPGL
jgi:two-component system cell cycle response regulator